MRLLVIALTIFALTSCASYPNYDDMSSISVGMTKAQVLEIKGKPTQTKAQGQVEYFLYGNPFFGMSAGNHALTYFVRFIKGRVEAYGHWGDFGSTERRPDATYKFINDTDVDVKWEIKEVN